ncbi:TonB family C-terminal domain protein [Verrucomicrobiia bacterium DG1235]|nr:TonB family C-terminal domain protein [Verrucomicrobiae bacterium DG1235]
MVRTLLSACILSGLAISLAHAGPQKFEFHEYGVDLNIEVIKMPHFPNSLIADGYLEGDVKIAMDIDHDGELRDWIVIESTHPEFTESVERVIDSWRFSPPYINGENRSVVNHLNIHFESRGSVVSFDLPTSVLNVRLNQLTGFRSEASKLSDIKELDTAPYPIAQPSPSIPKDVIQKHDGTRAVFTFYIDEAGQVRIPALSETDGEPDLGMLLATQDALSQWRFQPPTKNNRPVKVKLSQAFVFKDK